MEQNFLLSVKIDHIKDPYRVSLLREIANSKLRRLTDYHFNNGFVRYIGSTADITISLDYLLDEMLPLDDFVAISVDNNAFSLRGMGYRHHLFTPSLLFNDGQIYFTNLSKEIEYENYSSNE